jgi:hypothetical protein
VHCPLLLHSSTPAVIAYCTVAGQISYCVRVGKLHRSVVLTFQSLEDGFLFNQLRKIVGLLIAVARGDIPEHFINLAQSENAVLPVPCAPPHLGAIVDCICTNRNHAIASMYTSLSARQLSESVRGRAGCLQIHGRS